MRTYLLLMPLLLAMFAIGSARADELQYDQVEFNVQAEAEWPNDFAEVVLATEGEHADAARLANDINQKMGWALRQARAVDGIEIQSGDYQTYPVFEKDRLHHWRAMQSLILRSRNIDALTTLAGTLQQRLQVKSMRFMVSPERQRSGEAELIDSAMANFKERALRIQRGLGAKGYRLVRLGIDGVGTPPPMPMMMRMAVAEKDSAAAVAGEAGSSRHQLTLHAVIQLTF